MSWSWANKGLPWEGNSNVPDIRSLAIQGSALFAGNYRAGVWKRSIPEMIGSLGVDSKISPEAVLRTYPNPFSQSTQITFTPESAGYADVSVVNLLGQQVARLFSGEIGAGEHQFDWNAVTVPPGSYWCVIRFGDEVKRIALSVQR